MVNYCIQFQFPLISTCVPRPRGFPEDRVEGTETSADFHSGVPLGERFETSRSSRDQEETFPLSETRATGYRGKQMPASRKAIGLRYGNGSGADECTRISHWLLRS
jgi:hypothetical protein